MFSTSDQRVFEQYIVVFIDFQHKILWYILLPPKQAIALSVATSPWEGGGRPHGNKSETRSFCTGFGSVRRSRSAWGNARKHRDHVRLRKAHAAHEQARLQLAARRQDQTRSVASNSVVAPDAKRGDYLKVDKAHARLARNKHITIAFHAADPIGAEWKQKNKRALKIQPFLGSHANTCR